MILALRKIEGEGLHHMPSKPEGRRPLDRLHGRGGRLPRWTAGDREAANLMEDLSGDIEEQLQTGLRLVLRLSISVKNGTSE